MQCARVRVSMCARVCFQDVNISDSKSVAVNSATRCVRVCICVCVSERQSEGEDEREREREDVKAVADCLRPSLEIRDFAGADFDIPTKCGFAADKYLLLHTE